MAQLIPSMRPVGKSYTCCFSLPNLSVSSESLFTTHRHIGSSTPLCYIWLNPCHRCLAPLYCKGPDWTTDLDAWWFISGQALSLKIPFCNKAKEVCFLTAWSFTLLAVDVLWWTLPGNYSAFLARLGGRALGAPTQREFVLRHDWLAYSSKYSFASCPDLCCPQCFHDDHPHSVTLEIKEEHIKLWSLQSCILILIVVAILYKLILTFAEIQQIWKPKIRASSGNHLRFPNKCTFCCKHKKCLFYQK